MKQILSLVLVVMFGACVPSSSSPSYQPQPAYAAQQGIYVNGHLLTADETAQLEAIVGEAVPAGRYAMDAEYNFGYEGQAPVINLAEYARRRQQDAQQDRGMSMYSRDASGAGSSIVSEGGCTILSTPSGSLSSGC